MLIIITPSCLKVDSAMIFFKSDSAIAAIPAIVNVATEQIKRHVVKYWDINKNGENRINRKTPAVTKVEEWTSADTGVGAAIAAGSHLENGSWALFVIAAIRTKIIIRPLKIEIGWLIINQSPQLIIKEMDNRIITSPIRFVKAVSMPPAKDFGFW